MAPLARRCQGAERAVDACTAPRVVALVASAGGALRRDRRRRQRGATAVAQHRAALRDGAGDLSVLLKFCTTTASTLVTHGTHPPHRQHLSGVAAILSDRGGQWAPNQVQPRFILGPVPRTGEPPAGAGSARRSGRWRCGPTRSRATSRRSTNAPPGQPRWSHGTSGTLRRLFAYTVTSRAVLRGARRTPRELRQRTTTPW